MRVDEILAGALPEPPPPSAGARERAVAAALAALDEKNASTRQGSEAVARPRARTGTPPARSHGTRVMNRKGWAIAAGVALSAGAIPLALNMLTSNGSLDAGRMSMTSGFDGPSPNAMVQGRAAPSGETIGSAATARPQAYAANEAPAGRASSMVMSSPLPAPSSQGTMESARQAMQNSIVEAMRLGTARLQGEGSQATAQARAAHPASGFMGAPPSEAGASAEPQGRDAFQGSQENPYKVTREEPVSTFSMDVDTASYAFARASLARNALPPKASVRTEEFVNYFPYDYPAPATASEPFMATVMTFPSPWNEGRRIVHVGLKAYAVAPAERPPANLVFLVDTSGSMSSPNRLPLAKQALSLLVGQLDGRDRVAIVTYAGAAGTVLEPTPASDKARILAAIERLDAGGSTAGAEGIRQAYALAEANFDPKAVNRVMLATDGDFNVGITDRGELQGFVERKREKGVFLSVLGFGMGNYNDATMQALAQNGNGVAAYIDTLAEARKTLVEEATSSLVTVARDAKVQVEFDPSKVSEYRLVGYETRALRREDFNNDKVDAGDVGSGHTVTAIYEVVPAGVERVNPDLRYGRADGDAAPNGKEGEIGFVSLRYKLPGEERSRLATVPIPAAGARSFDAAPQESRFAVSVAGFAELLRGGRHTGRLTYDDVVRTASAAKGDDPYGYRSEFVQMVRAAKAATAMAPLERQQPGSPGRR